MPVDDAWLNVLTFLAMAGWCFYASLFNYMTRD